MRNWNRIRRKNYKINLAVSIILIL